jgi:hypothetical protein
LSTDTLTVLGSLSGMYPIPKQAEVADRRHAVKELAQGVGWMAEAGNSADVSAIVERLGSSLMEYAERYGEAKAKPRLPNWAVTTLVGMAVAFSTLFVTSLVTYGALQNRVSALESKTSNLDRLNSLDAKVDLLTGEFERMESRFNALMDGTKRVEK